ncbi:hypothetical protein C8Q80DRAFT_371994 [Daedaleopsis nitida]|nr:hypothetical protein C8Q80DRAFT_371994 [Daedaleopsis nitida]
MAGSAIVQARSMASNRLLALTYGAAGATFASSIAPLRTSYHSASTYLLRRTNLAARRSCRPTLRDRLPRLTSTPRRRGTNRRHRTSSPSAVITAAAAMTAVRAPWAGRPFTKGQHTSLRWVRSTHLRRVNPHKYPATHHYTLTIIASNARGDGGGRDGCMGGRGSVERLRYRPVDDDLGQRWTKNLMLSLTPAITHIPHTHRAVPRHRSQLLYIAMPKFDFGYTVRCSFYSARNLDEVSRGAYAPP